MATASARVEVGASTVQNMVTLESPSKINKLSCSIITLFRAIALLVKCLNILPLQGFLKD